MRRTTIVLIAAAALLVGCKNSGDIDVGLGEETDGRLTADVKTWDCTSEEQGDWMGALGFNITLEWVPDELEFRELPPMGTCAAGMSLFALDDQTPGQSIPRAKDNPRWRTANDTGRMSEMWTGLWFDDASDNIMGCGPISETIVDGVEIYDAGILDGARTPQAGDLTLVEINGESTSEFETGFVFGEELEVDWETGGWDESFVQIRRVRDKVAYQTVTCNTTGEDGITVDDEVWSLLDEDLNVDYNTMYVGFRNTEVWENDTGQKIDVATRALHVAGVLETED